jgi:hypothetical protein
VAHDDSGATLTSRESFTAGLHFRLTLRDGEIGATVDADGEVAAPGTQAG